MLNFRHNLYLIFISVFTTTMCYCSNLNTRLIKYGGHLPIINLNINDQSIYVFLNIGNQQLNLELDPQLIERYGHRTQQVYALKDGTGNIFKNKVVLINEIAIADQKFNNVLVRGYKSWVTNSTNQNKSLYIQGAIGLRFFKNRILILDFKNDTLEILDSIPSIYKSLHWINFKPGFKFNVAFHHHNLCATVDTSTNVSLINVTKLTKDILLNKHKTTMSPSIQSNIFVEPYIYPQYLKPMKNPWQLFVTDLSYLRMDLLVGMDVLRGKILLLDLVNNRFVIIN